MLEKNSANKSARTIKEKIFYLKFSAPINSNLTIDRLLNEY